MFAPQIKNILSFGQLDPEESLLDAPKLFARFRGTDKISIVSANIIPRYRKSWFSGDPIAAFMILSLRPPDREVPLSLIHCPPWRPFTSNQSTD